MDYEAARHARGDGQNPAWRFMTPDRNVSFFDSFCAEQSLNVLRATGDFVLARHPQGAGYQLAVVVDDAAMGVTEVIRGDDLLSSTPRQLLLYEALGLQAPAFAHVPLLVGPDGRRLAKRHGDTRIGFFRERGVRPQTLVGWLAFWSGLCSAPEPCMPADLISSFRLDRVPKGAVIIDESAQRKILDISGHSGC